MLESARQDFEKIIHVIEIYPDTNVIFGDPSCIDLANHLLKRSFINKHIPQLVSYDTTFNLGDFYVSVLVMRNTDIVGDPIFPVLFMIHERKLLRMHELFWGSFIKKLIHFEKYGHNVPIITDREKSIASAILNSISIADTNLIFCHNHLIRDVKQWLHTNNAIQDDFKVYINEIKYLIEIKNENEFDKKLNEYKIKWSRSFFNYFEKNIEYDLKNRCSFLKTNRFSAFANKTPTNNISESLNKMIKQWNDWKELPLDALVLSLYKMQIFYVNEFNRCYRNMGDFHIKDEYINKINEINIPVSYNNDDISEIVKNIKSNKIEPKTIIEKKSTYRMTQISLANHVLENKLIDYSPHLQVHIVRCAYSNKTHTVSKIRNNLQCTCTGLTTRECYHIMAVKFLTSDIQTDKNKVFKLSELKRKRTKGGRKAPRPGDIESSKIIRANDSLEADGLSLNFSGKKQCLIKSTTFQSKDKKELPKLKLNNTANLKGYETLMPCCWISSFVIDDVINYFIINNEKGSSILYIPSNMYEYFYIKDYTNIIQTFLDSDALNKDFILVTINTKPLQGEHWILGVIHLKLKKIIILDSLLDQNEREEHFINLLQITFLCYNVANYYYETNLKFKLHEWQCVYAEDAIQQTNSFDCGLYVCIHAYCYIKNIFFFNEPSNSGREWLFYNFNEYSKFKNLEEFKITENQYRHILNNVDINNILSMENENLEDAQFSIDYVPIQQLTISAKKSITFF